MTKKSLIAIASIATLLTISGLSPSSAANKTTTLCVNKKTFAVRMTSKCTKNEVKKTLITPTTIYAVNSNEGPQGGKGDTGVQGPAGEKGAKGDTGLTGPMGPQGLPGNYAVGSTGAQGPAGAKGDTGLTGPQGTAGAQGPAGAKGDTGLTGAQGPAGAKGDTGLTGPQGTAGAKGDTGLTGPQGTAGTSGFGASFSGSSSPVTLVVGKMYFLKWTAIVTPGISSGGFCRLEGNIGNGAELIDGGVAFGRNGTSSGTPILYNNINSTSLFTSNTTSATFNTVCVFNTGSDEALGSASSLIITLIPIN